VPIEVSPTTSEGAVLGWTTSAQKAVRLTVAEYVQLIDLGVVQEDEPVELLEGVVTRKMIKKPRHILVQETLGELLKQLVPSEWFVSEQNPMATPDSMPEPDCMIVRGRRKDYRDRYATPADLGLVIEVADSSLSQDRDKKQRIYAGAKVPIYWIINLVDDVVEVYVTPTMRPHPKYKERTDYSSGQKIPFVLDGKKIANIKVEDFLL
jgi:hypothetical protein